MYLYIYGILSLTWISLDLIIIYPFSSSCSLSPLLLALQSFKRENIFSTATEDGTYNEIHVKTSPMN